MRSSGGCEEPVFCQGWRDGTTTELQAPFWLYGAGPLTLTLSAERPIHVELSVDGHAAYEEQVDGASVAHLDFRENGWHAVVLDASSPGLGLDHVG
jgi:hypothetical protein